MSEQTLDSMAFSPFHFSMAMLSQAAQPGQHWGNATSTSCVVSTAEEQAELP